MQGRPDKQRAFSCAKQSWTGSTQSINCPTVLPQVEERKKQGLRSQTNSNRTLARQNTVKIINIILPVNGSAAGAVFDRDVEPGT